jgi:signal transduction histidine kinase
VGLAVVKKIVELHRGEVDVLSEGGETSFTVRIPQNG